MRLTKAMGVSSCGICYCITVTVELNTDSMGLDSRFNKSGNEIEQNKRSITFHVGFFIILSILNSTIWRFETTTRWDDNESIRISKILSNIEPRHPILLTRPSFIGSILDGHRAHSHVYWSRCQNLPHRLWPSILRLLGIDMHSSLH